MVRIYRGNVYKQYAQFVGLVEAAHIRSIFVYKNRKFKIVGVRPQRRSAPIVAIDRAGNLEYFPVRTINILFGNDENRTNFV